MVEEMITLGWRLYTGKVAGKLLAPENEKMMQLHLAQIFQTLAPLFERELSESIKVLLEVPVTIRGDTRRIIDIVIEHRLPETVERVAIELKCFRYLVRDGKGKRGAQNLGMFDYWQDIENIEGYCALASYTAGYQFTLTDDPYYPEALHSGPQVAVYSTSKRRAGVTGTLRHEIANRSGEITLRGSYDMSGWRKEGTFFFIAQRAGAEQAAAADRPRDRRLCAT
jgi:hypothetical protein